MKQKKQESIDLWNILKTLLIINGIVWTVVFVTDTVNFSKEPVSNQCSPLSSSANVHGGIAPQAPNNTEKQEPVVQENKSDENADISNIENQYYTGYLVFSQKGNVFTDGNKSKIFTIKNQTIFEKINEYYEVFYPLEFSACLVGKWIDENHYEINGFEKNILTSMTHVSGLLTQCMNGISIHSHPALDNENVQCYPSNVDLQTGDYLAIICGRQSMQEINFYQRKKVGTQNYLSIGILDITTKGD